MHSTLIFRGTRFGFPLVALILFALPASGDLLVGGSGGAIQIVTDDLTNVPPKSIQRALENRWAYAVATASDGTSLMGGTEGYIQKVDAQGVPIGNAQIALGGLRVRDLAWNGTQFLAVGDSGRVQLIDASGTPIGTEVTRINGSTAYVASWTGSVWLVAGNSGRYEILNPDLSVLVPWQTGMGGDDIYAGAWNGTHWLLAGETGTIQRIDINGTPAAAEAVALSGSHIEGVDTLGTDWIVAGASGRSQIIQADGTIVTASFLESGGTWRSASAGAGGYLLVADDGRMLKVDASGGALGSVQVGFEAKDIRDVTWTGSDWMAVGAEGRVQRVLSDGSPAIPYTDVLGNNTIRGAAWSPTGWIIGGTSYHQLIDASGAATTVFDQFPPALGQTFYWIYAALSTGDGWWVFGEDAQYAKINTDGSIANTFSAGFYDMYAAAFAPYGFLTGGQSGRMRTIASDGSTLSSEVIGLGGATIRAVATAGDRAVVTGELGRLQAVATDLSSLGPVQTVLSGLDVWAASSNGVEFLVGGEAGYVQRVDLDGNPLDFAVRVLESSTIRSIQWVGDGWIVGGTLGRLRKLNPDGTPASAVVTVLDEQTVYVVSPQAIDRAPQAACANDVECADGTCAAGVCACSAGCAIAGACYADGATNPNNACQRCDDAAPTVWSNVADGTSCGAGDLCEGTGTCGAGVCSATAVDCDDLNDCTADSCDPADGLCDHTQLSGGCDDGDACTAGDACSGGSCSGVAVSCDDGNPCTDDSCDPATGCSNVDNAAACDDGNPCTDTDVCAAGVCAGSAVVDGTSCDAGTACGAAGSCALGVCEPGAATPGCGEVLVGGEFGAVTRVPTDLEFEFDAVSGVLSGYDVYGIDSAPDGTSLAFGEAGRTRILDVAGVAQGSTVAALAGYAARGAYHNGTEWLLAGSSGRHQIIAADGTPVGSPAVAFDGDEDIRDVFWAGGQWLLVGSGGFVQTRAVDGTLGPIQVVLGGTSIRQVAFNGTHYLIGGDTGRIQLLDTSGNPAQDYEVALGGESVYGVAWNGDHFLVGGVDGHIQRVTADGRPEWDSFQVIGTEDWNELVAGGNGVLAVGDNGNLVYFDADSNPVGDVLSDLNGLDIFGLSFNGTSFVIGGEDGLARRRQLDAAGDLRVWFDTLFSSGGTVRTTEFSGSQWFAGAVNGNYALLAPDGSQNFESDFGVYDIYAAAWSGTRWIAVGENSRYYVIEADGTLVDDGIGNFSDDFNAAAWGGTEFFVAGEDGYSRRITTDGNEVGSEVFLLGGADIWSMSTTPTGYVVAGSQGRFQRVGLDGQPEAAYDGALSNQVIRAIAKSNNGYLFAGGNGRVQRFDANLEPMGPPQVALDGELIRAAVWTGAEWIIAGRDGRIQRLLEDGTPIGAVKTTLDAFNVWSLSYGAGAIPAGAACATDADCVAGTCEASGQCSCTGCAISGACYADGAANPGNACEVCQVASSPSAWTPGNEGANCSAATSCEAAGTCQSGACTAAPIVTCDDGQSCTDDACDPDTGDCIFTPNAAACDDGDPCTVGDACAAGVCAAGASVDCDDGNPCTDNACDSGDGSCTTTNNTVACDDGDACTVSDACFSGACVGSVAPDGTLCPGVDGCGASNYCLAGSCEQGPAAANCGNILVSGDQGAIQVFPSSFELPEPPVKTAVNGGEIYRLSQQGDTVLATAYQAVQLLDATGNPLSPSSDATGGWLYGADSDGDGWIVGGWNGRIRRVDSDGNPVGAYITRLDGEDVNMVVYGDGEFLLAGDAGMVQRVAADGSSLSTPADVLDGLHIISADWNGTHYLVCGAGWCRLLDAMGQPAAAMEPVVEGESVRDLVWAGDYWYLVAYEGWVQRLHPDGRVDAGSLVNLFDTTSQNDWNAMALGDDGILIAGDGGRMLKLDFDGNVVGSAQYALVRNDIFDAEAVAGGFLVSGDDGTVQRVNLDGTPAQDFQWALLNETSYASAWSDDRWIVGGDNYAVAVDPSGGLLSPGVSAGTALSNDAIFGLERGASHVLAVGDDGRHALLDQDANDFQGVSINGGEWYEASYGDGFWLMCGQNGICRTVDASGSIVGASTTVLDGFAVLGAEWVGDGWWVGGNSGRLQKVDSAGAAVGAYTTVLSDTIRVLRDSPGGILVAGLGGRYVVIDDTGAVVVPEAIALGGRDIRAAAWTGSYWIVGGAEGYVQRIAADGTLLGSAAEALGGLVIRSLTYGGPTTPAAGECLLDQDCQSLECNAGVCTADCTIDGQSYLAGERNPANDCLYCLPSTSTTAWTALGNGIACEDGDPCTVGDICGGGLCTSGPPKDCSDGDACTADICSPVDGVCSHPFVGGACPGQLLIGGERGSVAQIDPTLANVPTSFNEALNGFDIRAAARGPEDRTLIIDFNGVGQVVDDNGVAVTSPTTVLSVDADAVGWNGTHWLVGGVAGRVRLVDTAGQPVGSENTVISNYGVEEIVWSGTEWIVAGGNGRMQRLLPDGTAAAGTVVRNDGWTIYAMAMGPAGELLVGGVLGRHHHLDAQLNELTPVAFAPSNFYIYEIAYDGTNWMVAGSSGRTILVDGNGQTVPGSSFIASGSPSWWGLAAGANGWLAAGEDGIVQVFSANGIPTGSLQTAMNGEHVDHITWVGDQFLLFGDQGRIQIADANGQLQLPYDIRLIGRDTSALQWGGTQWLAAGEEVTQPIALDGSAVSSPIATFGSNDDVLSVAYGAGRWAAVGTSGQSVVWPVGGSPGSPTDVTGAGTTLRSAGFDGTYWLVAGDGGLTTRLLLDGGATGEAVIALHGTTVYAVASGGDGWLVAGDFGLVQRLNAAGQLLSEPAPVAWNHRVLAAGWNGLEFIVGGENGWIHRVSSDGQPVGAPIQTLDGRAVRTIAWVSDAWIVAGDAGAIQRVGADGTLETTVATALDGQTIYGAAYAGASFLDGAACSVGVTCTTGICEGGACSCPNGCAIDGACVASGATSPESVCLVCNPAVDPNGWSATVDGTACDDAGLCADAGTCAAGACVQSGLPDCDDSDPCTDDSCDPATGLCVQTPNTASCDDSNACTVGDVCSAGTCAGVVDDCDDSNPCTDDSCDIALGCQNDPNAAACDDGNACTDLGTCSVGACTAGPPLANGTACGTGACTANDTCQAGICSPGASIEGCAPLVIAGESGSIQRVNANLSDDVLNPPQLLDGFDIYGADAQGSSVLLVGSAGRVQLTDLTGNPTTTAFNAASSGLLRAPLWVGDGWLVAGDFGRTLRVAPDGSVGASWKTFLSSSSIYDVAPIGTGDAILVGSQGRYQIIDDTTNVTASAGVQTLPSSTDLRAVVWTGTHAIVGTDDGQLWRLAGDGTVVDGPHPILGGGGVRALAWLNGVGLAVGLDGRRQLFDAAATADPASFAADGSDWLSAAAGDGVFALGSDSGEFMVLDTSGQVVRAPQVGVGGQAIYALPHTATGFLLVGRDEFTQALDDVGVPLVPYAQLSNQNIARTVAFDGSGFLVGATALAAQYDAELIPGFEIDDPLDNGTTDWTTYVVGWNGTQWLAAGQIGRFRLIDADGTEGPLGSVDNSYNVFTASWSGTEWLLAGANGQICRLDSNGNELGCQIGLDSQDIYSSTWTGTEWLVGGEGGRVQRVAADGTPTGAVQLAVFNFSVRALAAGDDHVLAGGDEGWVELLNFDGSSAAAAVSALDTNDVRSAVYTSNGWVVGGFNGALRRIDAAGQTVGPIATGLYGRDVYAMAYAGPSLDAGGPCALDLECLSGGCDSGQCQADCVIGGIAYLQGSTHPTNTCWLCDPAQDDTDWTILADAASCSDGDACTTGDQCSGGVCQAGAPVSCDDGIDCSVDTCDPNSGSCIYDVSGAPTCLTCGDGIIDDYTIDEGFESGALPQGYSATSWAPTTSHAATGTYGLGTGIVPDSGAATLAVTATTADGDVCFKVRGSSQDCCDRFRFAVDGSVEVDTANLEWTTFCVAVTAGEHTFTWSYAKNAGSTAGEDAYYLDDIQLPQREACDDANLIPGDGCNETCESVEVCGNGYVDVTEACDDGNTVAGDGCNANCSSNETCGNGVQDPGEACDDGNSTGGDGCSALCLVEGICGDGSVDVGQRGIAFAVGAGLAEGPLWTSGAGPWSVSAGAGASGSDAAVSGNAGVAYSTSVMQLDQAGAQAGQVCFWAQGDTAAAGDALEFSVDGQVEATLDSAPAGQTVCVAVSAGDHTYAWAYVKDGALDAAVDSWAIDDIVLPTGPIEICDDGNETAADGCSADCQSAETCGNGIIDVGLTPPETCDLPPASAPTGVGATAVAGGFVAVSWTDLGESGVQYALYRSATPLVDATGLTPLAFVDGDSFADRPPADATWHYAVAPFKAFAGLPSAPLSASVSATSDGTAPSASIVFSSALPLAEGNHPLALTTSEPLATAPTLTWTPFGSSDVFPVALSPTPANPNIWVGSLDVITATPNGVASFAWQGTDGVGNSAGPITSGGVFPIDTDPLEPPSNVVVTASSADSLDIQWAPSPNSNGDLAGYRVRVDGTQVDEVSAGTTTASLSGLTASTAYGIEVAAFDTGTYETPAATATGYTWIDNPGGVAASGHDQRVDITWSEALPAAHVSAYRIYVETSDFSSVAGLTPSAEVSALALAASVTGLDNATPYFIAVTAVTLSGGERPDVTTVSATPSDDAAPEAPSSLTVSAATGTTLQVFWSASVDTLGDLVSYELSVDGTPVGTVPAGTLTYTFTSLLPSESYTLGVASVDGGSNTSSPRTRTGYTWMPNPTGVAVTAAKHEKLEIQWTPPTPQSHIQAFRVYASTAPFTSVDGLAPVVTTSSGTSSATIEGLVNGQTYFVAVTTVNRSNSQNPAVTTTTGAPVEDTTGPALGPVTFEGATFSDGAVVSASGTFAITATDPEGVEFARFTVDGTVLAIDQTPNNGFEADYSLLGVPDGPHSLVVDLEDGVGNPSSVTINFTSELAPPPAPSISQPADGTTVNDPSVLVTGSAQPSATVKVSVGGAEQPGSVVADSAGVWSLLVELQPGLNALTATATNPAGTGPLSAAVSVDLDLSVPPSPLGVTATAQADGAVQVVWYVGDPLLADEIAGHRIYRADAPFTTVAEATLLNASLVPNYLYDDSTPSDGVWYYGVTAVNDAGTESPLGELATVTSDSTPPVVTEFTVTPQGAYAEPRIGVGPVSVRVVFDEPLLTSPFLTVNPGGGLPITVGLAESPDGAYEGVFSVKASTLSGVATASLSARDAVGNRTTELPPGSELLIDTDAPEIEALTLAPDAPIQNDSAAPVSVAVTVELTDPMPDGFLPELSYRLTQSQNTPTDLVLIEQSPGVYSATVPLGTDAGAIVEALAFDYFAVDDLGNETTTIQGKSTFEVYQGELPALNPPVSLTGQPLPAGQAQLSWPEVPGASEYAIYRSATDATGLAIATTVTDTEYVDMPGPDGTYLYAVASVRQENGQQAESALGPATLVETDSVAPGAPSGLSLVLAANGIGASYLAPDPLDELVTYSLYRSADLTLTDVTGLTPLASGVPGLTIVDTDPSDTEHTYVVTAVDEAGNESAPSASDYLNAGLLPVNSLSVLHDVAAGAEPVVSWTHGTTGLQGYYITVDGSQVPGGPLAAVLFNDTDWDFGPRVYGVRAVDTSDFESLERFVTLPNVEFAPVAGSRLTRGQITELVYLVTSDTDLPFTELEVTVGGQTHVSSAFTATAGQTKSVSVVVGGYASLGDTADVTASLGIDWTTGETVEVRRAATLSVDPASYVASLQVGQLIENAVVPVTFTFQNTGEVAVELLSAQGGGTQPSGEVRIQLEDTDGNVLSTSAFNQPLGEGVINVTGGFTVARVQPGESFTSDSIDVEVPEGAPSELVVRLVVDSIHYNLGKSDHVEIGGLDTTVDGSTEPAPYDPVVLMAVPAVTQGEQPTVISGEVRDANNALVADVPLELYVETAGFVRTFDLYSDQNGAFSHAFEPLPTEGGVYNTWANFPGGLQNAPEGQFTVQRVLVTPSPTVEMTVAANYLYSVPIEVQAFPGTPLTNLRLEPSVLPTGVEVTAEAPQDVAGGSATALSLSLLVTGQAPTNGLFALSVLSDEGTWAVLQVDYTLTEALPSLAVNPTFVETGAARGGITSESVELVNEGLASFQDLELSLLNASKTGPAPSWVFVNTPSLGGLEVGGTTSVSMTVAPTAGTALSGFAPYQFWLRVKDLGDTVLDVPVFVWVDDSGVGGHLFKVSDIYTATPDEFGDLIPGLAGAKIKMDKLFGDPHSATLYTDSQGEALFAGLPVGTYRARLSASGHEAKEFNIVIKPGVVSTSEVLLDIPLVTFEWSVTETTVQDEYTVVLVAVFETDVPAPVVVQVPSSVTLPDMEPGDVFYAEYTLINYGLITANDITPQIPDMSPYWEFELLTQPPEDLLAKAEVTIPYRITRLDDPVDDTDTGDGGSGDGGSGDGGSGDGGSGDGGSGDGGSGDGGSGDGGSGDGGSGDGGSGDGGSGDGGSGDGGSGDGGSGDGGSGDGGGGSGGGSGGGGSGGGGSGGGGGCYAMAHRYYYICANGLGGSGGTGMGISAGGGCTINPTGSGSGSGGYPWGSPNGSGGPGCDPCESPSASAAERKCCRDHSGQSTGSEVGLVSGAYSDEATDLTVKVMGWELELWRRFAADAWTFRFEGDALDITFNGTEIDNIVYRGGSFVEVDETNTIFGSGDDRIFVVEGEAPVAYRWVSANGFYDEFDASGALLAFSDPNGRRVSIDRTAQGQVQTLRDANDQVFATYTYAGGQLAQIALYDGRTATYTWTNDTLTAVSVSDKGTSTYEYDNLRRMTGKQLYNGEAYTIAYTSDDVVSSVLDAFGQGYYFDYGYNTTTQLNYSGVLSSAGDLEERWWDNSGNIVNHTLNGEPVAALEERSQFVEDNGGTVLKTVYKGIFEGAKFTFNQAGAIAEYQDDRGIITRPEYDDQNNEIGRVQGFGRADAQVTSYAYDALGNLETETLEGDAQTGDLVTTFTYDAYGNEQSRTEPGGLLNQYEYDAAGRVTRHTDPAGTVREYEYDGQDRYTKLTTSGPGIAPREETWTRSLITDVDGRVLGEQVVYVDGAGRSTTVQSDLDGRDTKRTDHWGRSETWEYDSRGRELTHTTPDGVTTTTSYSSVPPALTRATSSIDGVVVRIVDTDIYDRVVREIDADGLETVTFYDGGLPEPAEVVHPRAREVFEYDDFGRNTSITYIGDGGEQFEREQLWWGSQNTGFTDPLGVFEWGTFDLLNQLESRYIGNEIQEVVARDALRRAVGFTDGAGKSVLTRTFDAQNRVASRDFPDGTQYLYGYDGAGRITSIEMGSGERVTQTYDALGRLKAMSAFDPGNAVPAATLTYAYDALDRVTSTVSPASTRTIAYDDFARTETVTVDFGPFSKTFSYALDSRGRRVGYTSPEGVDHAYEYDADGRVVGIDLDFGAEQHTVDYARTAAGTTATFDSDLTLDVLRTDFNQIGQVVAADSGGTPIVDWQITRNAYRVEGVTSTLGNYTYAYDDRGRLLGATYPTFSADAFAYDDASNRISSAQTGAGAWTYNGSDQLTQIAGVAGYTYDAFGSRATRTDLAGAGGTTTFVYDGFGQLTEVTDSGGSTVALYRYDAEGFRISKTVGSEVIYFLYDDVGLIGEYDAQGNPLRTYSWYPTHDEWDNSLVYMRQNGVLGWAISDHMGTPVALMDPAGDVVWSAETRAFGAATAAPTSVVDCPLRMSRQYFDAETGLHYNTYRYYDPATGAYISRDPLVEQSDEFNFYRFSTSDPINDADRFGQVSVNSNGVSDFGFDTPLGGGKVGGRVSVEPCCKEGPETGRQVCIQVRGSASAGPGIKGEVGARCKVCTGCLGGRAPKCGVFAAVQFGKAGFSFGPVKVGVSGPKIQVGADFGPGGFSFNGPSVKGPRFNF